ncbi:MAG TPA: hypothetical protein VLV87_01210 [Gammaproteobacteria bacterium]|nr:hypothetical protein [Gammaproteobacteria bacterium]
MKHIAALLLLSALPLAAHAEPTSSMPRILKSELAATGINGVALEVGVGELHVTTSNDDKVHVQVTLRHKERQFLWFFHWMDGGSASQIAAATIQQKRGGDRLTLSLSYPHSGDDDMKQEWDVQIPPRLRLDATMEVGDLGVDGVSGGVTARLNVGEVSIDVPQGSIDASVDVGEIRAKTATAKRGKIQLITNIGDAMLVIQGSESGYHDHGGLGTRVSLDGSGPDAVQLKVNIGDVSLHVTPADKEITR